MSSSACNATQAIPLVVKALWGTQIASCDFRKGLIPTTVGNTQGHGCSPDVVTYTALISAFERGGQWRRALQVRICFGIAL